MDSEILYIISGFIAGAIPVSIIFYVLIRIRRKKETGAERNERMEHKSNLKEQLKSVEEKRVEEKPGISKTKN